MILLLVHLAGKGPLKAIQRRVRLTLQACMVRTEGEGQPFTLGPRGLALSCFISITYQNISL